MRFSEYNVNLRLDNHSHSMRALWFLLYIVVLVISKPQYIYPLYVLYCFTEALGVKLGSRNNIIIVYAR